MGLSRLTRDGTAEPVSRDQVIRREQGQQGKNTFPCSVDHEQDWQPYPVDLCCCYMCEDYDHTWAWRMSELGRDGTAEPVSRNQSLRCKRGQGKKRISLCLADHELIQ